MMKPSKGLSIALLAAIGVIAGGVMLAGGDAKTGSGSPEAETHAHAEHTQDRAESAGHAHGDADEHGHEDKDHGHDHADATEISDEAAASMGIRTVQAGPYPIRETIRLSGRVMLNQNRSAAVKARFPGVVRNVFKQVGDAVKRGDTLATVESNESLQVYAVPAPLDGVVLERNASIGDTAGDAAIFTVADLGSLWAEFFVFAGDMDAIRQGQPIILRTLDGKVSAESTLATIQPTAEVSSQTVLARAVIDNSAGYWRAGMTVQGYAVTAETDVAVSVPNEAIQSVEGKTVIFTKQGQLYTARPVKTGRKDAMRTQITHGLKAGEDVVAEGSFIVKADIGKSGAAHEH